MPLGESMKSTLKVIRLLRLINQGDLERYLEAMVMEIKKYLLFRTLHQRIYN